MRKKGRGRRKRIRERWRELKQKIKKELHRIFHINILCNKISSCALKILCVFVVYLFNENIK